FGYDEPNYTYTTNGRKLIGELAVASRASVHIRTHFLLATGDGTPALKWGSTNAYTEDASGKAVYDWTIVDRILGTYVEAGATPLVEIGFMPKALSTHPDPYTPVWKPGDRFDRYNTGWTYPPNDYAKWSELIYQWVSHCVTKYGRTAVEKWDWEVWNEPNIGYWHGTPEEYDRLYDFTAAAVKRALPTAKVGGPASTGPGDERAASFLRQFLEHCSSGRNYVTGQKGSPLDFISFHAKGSPGVVDGHVQMGISHELRDVSRGFEIVQSFPAYSNLPIILSEADPEGCAACSARVYPPNAYRNGSLYPAYTAAAMKALLETADRQHAHLEGILTWAFEFEEQPYFDGFRTLATNGIDKPVLNFFRMAGLMDGDLVRVDSSGAVPLDVLTSEGVKARSDVDALATRSEHKAAIMIWNYRDDDVDAPEANIHLQVSGLPSGLDRVLVRHYRIDQDHSNAYTAWKRMGSPQNPSAEQYQQLERAGQLQLLNSPSWLNVSNGSADLGLALPLQALSLVEMSW
ncbi:MAG: beta-xylosidase, partial [Acidobacteria bacterium]|nr:beta-xylosidase [Acidobacteriota bacterium]